jgi:hypothetical protein
MYYINIYIVIYEKIDIDINCRAFIHLGHLLHSDNQDYVK